MSSNSDHLMLRKFDIQTCLLRLNITLSQSRHRRVFVLSENYISNLIGLRKSAISIGGEWGSLRKAFPIVGRQGSLLA